MIREFILQHPFYTGLATLWIANNLVGSLPTPQPGDSKTYKIFFGFTHSTVGQLPRIFATMVPPQWKAAFLAFFPQAADRPDVQTSAKDADPPCSTKSNEK